MNATQKWASTSFLARNTADPCAVARLLQELRGRYDLHPRPHRLVADAAVFVTGHQLLTGRAKRRRERGYEAGDEHRVRVRLSDDEAVHGVAARAAKRDRHFGRHDDARWNER